MDASPVSPESLFAATLGFPGPQILDVRPDAAFATAEHALPCALRRDPGSVIAWAGTLELHRPVVACCLHGHAASQEVSAALAGRGLAAHYLEGGIEGWAALGLPLAPKPGRPSVWVTRARPKVDRVACPWLLRRFVDPDARILFVPPTEVARVAEATGGTAFDIPDAPYTHEGEGCSFDAFLTRHRPDDPALALLARIIRGADTERPDLHPAAGGLFAAALGFSALIPDDHALLRHAFPFYDALYLWCRDLQQEVHRWSPAAPG